MANQKQYIALRFDIDVYNESIELRNKLKTTSSKLLKELLELYEKQ